MDLTKAFIVEDGAITAREVITAVNTSSVVHRRQELDDSVSLLQYLDEVMSGVFLGAYSFETVEHQARDTPTTGVRVYHA
jgi:3-deoxy-D-arabino-heptulosonate 7-phosphate (DAHP) synthase